MIDFDVHFSNSYHLFLCLYSTTETSIQWDQRNKIVLPPLIHPGTAIEKYNAANIPDDDVKEFYEKNVKH